MTRFRRMLFVDEPDVDQRAGIARAAALAANNQAELTVLHVAEEPRLGIFADLINANQNQVHKKLEALAVERIDAEWHDVSQPFTRKVRFGTGFIEVIREVLEGDYDLVLKVAGDRRFLAPLAAGMDRHLVRKCPSPVWLMRAHEETDYRQVVAAVDFDPWHGTDGEGELNRRILDMAAAIALSESAELTIVHAWTPISDRMISVFASDMSQADMSRNLERERQARERDLRDLGEALRARIGEEGYGFIAPTFRLLQGEPAESIAAAVRGVEADLVVMGTVSRTGIPGLIIGNTAETILGSLTSAVLAVKPDDFETPVIADR